MLKTEHDQGKTPTNCAFTIEKSSNSKLIRLVQPYLRSKTRRLTDFTFTELNIQFLNTKI